MKQKYRNPEDENEIEKAKELHQWFKTNEVPFDIFEFNAGEKIVDMKLFISTSLKRLESAKTYRTLIGVTDRLNQLKTKIEHEKNSASYARHGGDANK